MSAPPPNPDQTTSTPQGSSTTSFQRVLATLVGVLCVAMVALGAVVAWQGQQISKLKHDASQTSATATAEASPVATEQPTTQPTTQQTTQPRATPHPTTGAQAEQLLKLARRQANDPLAKGKVDAPIVIIEWADYRCPFCARHSLQTSPQLQPYIDSGSVRLEFRDFVIFGDESQLAAQGARAAGRQGKYWEFANALWRMHTGQGHPTMTMNEMNAAAQAAGVPDMAKFAKDIQDPAIAAAVKKDSKEAASLGLNSTPFFLVGTTPVSGAQPVEVFIQLLEGYGATK